MKNIAVVGGGIAGLAAAWELRSLASAGAVRVELIEAGPRLGGSIVTERREGFVIEGGPDSFLTRKPDAKRLCEEAGISQSLISPSSGKTYIYHGGRMHPLPPVSPAGIPIGSRALRRSGLFSAKGKMRASLDLILPRDRRIRNGGDISAGAFIGRRLGSEVVERLVAPLAGGSHLTDVSELSVRAVLPAVVDLEKRGRSLIIGSLRESRDSRGPPQGTSPGTIPFATLDNGLSALVDAVASQLRPAEIRLSTKVATIEKKEDGLRAALVNQGSATYDGIVLATPAFTNAEMFKQSFPELSSMFGRIRYSSVIVVGLIYNDSDIPTALEGCGFLAPRDEKLSISGATWVTSKWKYANTGKGAVVRAFLDDRTDMISESTPDSAIVDAVRKDLKETTGITAAPRWIRIFRHTMAMPQYRVGHLGWVSKVKETATSWKGLALAGALYGGVGIPDCIRSGRDAAHEVAGMLSLVQ